jgi:predicted secreted protein
MTLNEYVNQIVIELKVRMEQSPIFPFDDGKREAGEKPRPQFKPHARNVALKNNYITVVSPDVQVFELGNERAERTAPQYHILEDAKIIANPGRGTAKSRGSQAKIADKAKRDYSVDNFVSSSSKVSQEYRPSFKEGRRTYDLIADKQWKKESNRKTFKTQNKFRYNEHYAYIERILEKETLLIAKDLDITLESYRGLTVADEAVSLTFGDIENNLLLGLFGGLGI